MFTEDQVNRMAVGIATVIIEKVQEAANKHARRTCMECVNFDRDAEACKLAGQRPPAQVIAYGCPAYVHDDIPF